MTQAFQELRGMLDRYAVAYPPGHELNKQAQEMIYFTRMRDLGLEGTRPEIRKEGQDLNQILNLCYKDPLPPKGFGYPKILDWIDRPGDKLAEFFTARERKVLGLGKNQRALWNPSFWSMLILGKPLPDRPELLKQAQDPEDKASNLASFLLAWLTCLRYQIFLGGCVFVLNGDLPFDPNGPTDQPDPVLIQKNGLMALNPLPYLKPPQDEAFQLGANYTEEVGIYAKLCYLTFSGVPWRSILVPNPEQGPVYYDSRAARGLDWGLFKTGATVLSRALANSFMAAPNVQSILGEDWNTITNEESLGNEVASLDPMVYFAKDLGRFRHPAVSYRDTLEVFKKIYVRCKQRDPSILEPKEAADTMAILFPVCSYALCAFPKVSGKARRAYVSRMVLRGIPNLNLLYDAVCRLYTDELRAQDKDPLEGVDIRLESTPSFEGDRSFTVTTDLEYMMLSPWQLLRRVDVPQGSKKIQLAKESRLTVSFSGLKRVLNRDERPFSRDVPVPVSSAAKVIMSLALESDEQVKLKILILQLMRRQGQPGLPDRAQAVLSEYAKVKFDDLTVPRSVFRVNKGSLSLTQGQKRFLDQVVTLRFCYREGPVMPEQVTAMHWVLNNMRACKNPEKQMATCLVLDLNFENQGLFEAFFQNLSGLGNRIARFVSEHKLAVAAAVVATVALTALAYWYAQDGSGSEPPKLPETEVPEDLNQPEHPPVSRPDPPRIGTYWDTSSAKAYLDRMETWLGEAKLENQPRPDKWQGTWPPGHWKEFLDQLPNLDIPPGSPLASVVSSLPEFSVDIPAGITPIDPQLMFNLVNKDLLTRPRNWPTDVQWPPENIQEIHDHMPPLSWPGWAYLPATMFNSKNMKYPSKSAEDMALLFLSNRANMQGVEPPPGWTQDWPPKAENIDALVESIKPEWTEQAVSKIRANMNRPSATQEAEMAAGPELSRQADATDTFQWLRDNVSKLQGGLTLEDTRTVSKNWIQRFYGIADLTRVQKPGFWDTDKLGQWPPKSLDQYLKVMNSKDLSQDNLWTLLTNLKAGYSGSFDFKGLTGEWFQNNFEDVDWTGVPAPENWPNFLVWPPKRWSDFEDYLGNVSANWKGWADLLGKYTGLSETMRLKRNSAGINPDWLHSFMKRNGVSDKDNVPTYLFQRTTEEALPALTSPVEYSNEQLQQVFWKPVTDPLEKQAMVQNQMRTEMWDPEELGFQGIVYAFSALQRPGDWKRIDWSQTLKPSGWTGSWPPDSFAELLDQMDKLTWYGKLPALPKPSTWAQEKWSSLSAKDFVDIMNQINPKLNFEAPVFKGPVLDWDWLKDNFDNLNLKSQPAPVGWEGTWPPDNWAELMRQRAYAGVDWAKVLNLSGFGVLDLEGTNYSIDSNVRDRVASWIEKQTKLSKRAPSEEQIQMAEEHYKTLYRKENSLLQTAQTFAAGLVGQKLGKEDPEAHPLPFNASTEEARAIQKTSEIWSINVSSKRAVTSVSNPSNKWDRWMANEAEIVRIRDMIQENRDDLSLRLPVAASLESEDIIRAKDLPWAKTELNTKTSLVATPFKDPSNQSGFKWIKSLFGLTEQEVASQPNRIQNIDNEKIPGLSPEENDKARALLQDYRVKAQAEAQARAEAQVREAALARAQTESRTKALEEARALIQQRTRELEEARAQAEAMAREVSEVHVRAQEQIPGVFQTQEKMDEFAKFSQYADLQDRAFENKQSPQEVSRTLTETLNNLGTSQAGWDGEAYKASPDLANNGCSLARSCYDSCSTAWGVALFMTGYSAATTAVIAGYYVTKYLSSTKKAALKLAYQTGNPDFRFYPAIGTPAREEPAREPVVPEEPEPENLVIRGPVPDNRVGPKVLESRFLLKQRLLAPSLQGTVLTHPYKALQLLFPMRKAIYTGNYNQAWLDAFLTQVQNSPVSSPFLKQTVMSYAEKPVNDLPEHVPEPWKLVLDEALFEAWEAYRISGLQSAATPILGPWVDMFQSLGPQDNLKVQAGYFTKGLESLRDKMQNGTQ